MGFRLFLTISERCDGAFFLLTLFNKGNYLLHGLIGPAAGEPALLALKMDTMAG